MLHVSAVATRKSKLELAVIAASCTFLLSLLGAAFIYWRRQLHNKLKNEVFVDVAGIRLEVFCVFAVVFDHLLTPTELGITRHLLLNVQVRS